jgi:hypothetical protein
MLVFCFEHDSDHLVRLDLSVLIKCREPRQVGYRNVRCEQCIINLRSTIATVEFHSSTSNSTTILTMHACNSNSAIQPLSFAATLLQIQIESLYCSIFTRVISRFWPTIIRDRWATGDVDGTGWRLHRNDATSIGKTRHHGTLRPSISVGHLDVTGKGYVRLLGGRQYSLQCGELDLWMIDSDRRYPFSTCTLLPNRRRRD